MVARKKQAMADQVNAYAFTPIDADWPLLRNALRPWIVHALCGVSRTETEMLDFGRTS
jgi:hypothetical protein